MASVDIYQMTTKDTNHKVAPVTIFDAVVNPQNKKTLDQEFEDMVGAVDESVAVDDADATLVTTALRKTQQVLTQAEKKQVRTNINAADADVITELREIAITSEEDEGDVNFTEPDVVNEAIRKVPQVLSKAEQKQARTNIGAASVEENAEFLDGVEGAIAEIDAKVSDIGSEVNSKIKSQDDVIDDFKEAITDQINNYKPIEINGNVTNAADEEDLTSKNGLLKLKDRSALNGMGYVIIRKDKPIQDQIKNSNTIYELRHFVDLKNVSLLMPKQSILYFNGGAFLNGVIVGNNTFIDECYNCLQNVKLEGTFTNKELSITSFGAKAAENSSDASNECSANISMAVNSGFHTITIPEGLFLTSHEIKIENPICLRGSNREKSIIQALWGTTHTLINVDESLRNVTICNLSIIGRDSNENLNNGISMIETYDVLEKDMENRVQNVTIKNMRGFGISVKARANYFESVYIYNTKGEAGFILRGTDHTVNNVNLYVCPTEGMKISGRNNQLNFITAKICGTSEGANAVSVLGSQNILSNLVVQQNSGNGVYIDGVNNSVDGNLDAIGNRNASRPIVLADGCIGNYLRFTINNNTLQQSFLYAYRCAKNTAFNSLDLHITRYFETSNAFAYTDEFDGNYLNDICINGKKIEYDIKTVQLGKYTLNKTSEDQDSNVWVSDDNVLHIYHRPTSYNANGYTRVAYKVSCPNNSIIHAKCLAKTSKYSGAVRLCFIVKTTSDEIIKVGGLSNITNGFKYDYDRISGMYYRTIASTADLSGYEFKEVYIAIEAVNTELASDGSNLSFDAVVLNLDFSVFVPSEYILNTSYIGESSNRPTFPSEGQMFFDTSIGKPIWHKGDNIWVDSSGQQV